MLVFIIYFLEKDHEKEIFTFYIKEIFKFYVKILTNGLEKLFRNLRVFSYLGLKLSIFYKIYIISFNQIIIN